MAETRGTSADATGADGTDKTILLSALHDRSGRLIGHVAELWPELSLLYARAVVTVSDQTAPELAALLEHFGTRVEVIPKRGAADARRRVLAAALDGPGEYFHYCDFDRLLTWQRRFPDELAAVAAGVAGWDYLILGRATRAFETHPREWRAADELANTVFSLEFGQKADIVGGSCGISRRAAALILENSTAKTTDSEWPMLVWRLGGTMSIGYLPVEGLEYDPAVNGPVASNMPLSRRYLERIRLCHEIAREAVEAGRRRRRTFD